MVRLFANEPAGFSVPEGDVQTINSDTSQLTTNPALQGTVDSSAAKPNYTYTRLGLWAPSSAGSTPSHEERSDAAPAITTPTPLAISTPSPDSNLYKNAADEQESSLARDESTAKSVSPDSSGMADLSTPVADEGSPNQTDVPAAGSTEPENPEDTVQGQTDVPLPSPTAPPAAEPTPVQGPSDGNLQAAPEEQSLKELVLEYLRTMGNNDSSTQERLLAGRVNFYGKGVLSFPEISGVHGALSPPMADSKVGTERRT